MIAAPFIFPADLAARQTATVQYYLCASAEYLAGRDPKQWEFTRAGTGISRTARLSCHRPDNPRQPLSGVAQALDVNSRRRLQITSLAPHRNPARQLLAATRQELA